MSNEIYLNMFGYIFGFGFALMLLAMTIHSPGIVLITIWPIIGIPAAMISNMMSKKQLKIQLYQHFINKN